MVWQAVRASDGGMDSAMRIAVSGLGAASLWLNAAASNIVNMRTRGPLPATPPGQDVPQGPGQVYQARRVAQTAGSDGSVSASLQTSLPSYRTAFDPHAPFANADGMVAEPDVDIAKEFVNLIQARAAFGASLAVIRTVRQNNKSLFDLIV
jgi:flagellar basal-body rod protein FlgC